MSPDPDVTVIPSGPGMYYCTLTESLARTSPQSLRGKTRCRVSKFPWGKTRRHLSGQVSHVVVEKTKYLIIIPRPVHPSFSSSRTLLLRRQSNKRMEGPLPHELTFDKQVRLKSKVKKTPRRSHRFAQYEIQVVPREKAPRKTSKPRGQAVSLKFTKRTSSLIHSSV